MKKLLLIFFLFLIWMPSFSQIKPYNENSIRPIYEDDIMFRKTVTRRINLKEKPNKPLYSNGREISSVIVEAVKNKKITGYTGGDIYFNANNKLKVDTDSSWLSKQDTLYGQLPIQPDEITILEITEDVIFDKKRSRMYVDIQSLTLVAPGLEVGGGDRYLATLKFKELHTYFRELYNTSNKDEGIWYNPQNNRGHMCLSDAFDLRLFSSRIIKVSNPDNLFLNEIYPDPREELVKAQEAEYELMEFEHNLWEF